MTGRFQISKSGTHQGGNFNAGKLAKELRTQWQREHSRDESVPVGTIRHLERAKRYPLPEEIELDSMVARSFHRYLEIRGTMSQKRSEKLGQTSPGVATERLVCEELLLPNQESAPIQDVLDVSRGISIAKIALKQTLS